MNRRSVIQTCRVCKTEFPAKRSEVAKGHAIFCGKGCQRALSRDPVQIADRFWKKVSVGDAEACWDWQAHRDKDGYGTFWKLGTNVHAHRVAYALNIGDPGSFSVLHHCDNPPCCNPKHLFLGTPLDNMRDMIAKGRRPNVVGRAHSRAKLSDESVRTIRAASANGVSHAELGRRFGVHFVTIFDAVQRKTWKHVG